MSTKNTGPMYPNLKPWELEPHYSKHVSAMTSEALHSKAAIAEQLAWRDKRIEALEEQLRKASGAGWIAYVDEPPDSDVYVVVANAKGSRLLAQLEFTDDSEGHGKPYWVSGGFDFELSDYPYWWPLPSLPAAPPDTVKL